MSTLYDSRRLQLRRIRAELSRGIPEKAMSRALADNEWFTRKDARYALRAIVEVMLDDEAVKKWLTRYPDVCTGLRVAIIMAGNIPMAGFFDLLCCALTGCRPLVKYSSKDRALMEWAGGVIAECTDTEVSEISENDITDAVIASGSDNAASLIRARFDGLPMVLRSHRVSVAVMDGTESAEEFSALWHDIFTYFTLGCRNVTHIYLPEGYPPELLAKRITDGGAPVRHRPWNGSYRQRRALAIMNGERFTDGGYFILCPAMQSDAVCQITYSYYASDDAIAEELAARDDLQCAIGHGRVPFGEAQRPAPWDYPDGRDVIEFLASAAFSTDTNNGALPR